MAGKQEFRFRKPVVEISVPIVVDDKPLTKEEQKLAADLLDDKYNDPDPARRMEAAQQFDVVCGTNTVYRNTDIVYGAKFNADTGVVPIVQKAFEPTIRISKHRAIVLLTDRKHANPTVAIDRMVTSGDITAPRGKPGSKLWVFNLNDFLPEHHAELRPKKAPQSNLS